MHKGVLLTFIDTAFLRLTTRILVLLDGEGTRRMVMGDRKYPLAWNLMWHRQGELMNCLGQRRKRAALPADRLSPANLLQESMTTSGTVLADDELAHLSVQVRAACASGG